MSLHTQRTHAFYTYASLTHEGHADINAICDGLTGMGIAHTRMTQTVTASVSDAMLARISMVCDAWDIANEANLLSTPV